MHEVVKYMQDRLGEIVGYFADAGTRAAQAFLTNLKDSGFKTIGSTLAGLARGAANPASFIRDGIPGFASGGVVRARPGLGTIVRVGEGRDDEAIVPIRRGSGGGAPAPAP